MAALEKIRNRSGLLIVIVGIALLSFILGDLFSGGATGGQVEIATVNGEKIYYLDYQQRVDEAVENVKSQSGQASMDEREYAQIQDQIWNTMTNKIIMDSELEALGIDVTSDEFLDMIQGNNVHPEVRNVPVFQDPETGAFDPNRVVQFLQNLDEDQTGRSREAWLSFEEYLLQQRKDDKYYSAIQKGMYITDLYAKEMALEKVEKVDLKAVYVPYTTINDTLITVTDADLNNYYQQNKEKYKQNESLDIEYVVFPIAATQADIQLSIDELNDLKNEFTVVKDNQAYVNANSDGMFDSKFYRQDEYSNKLVDSVMFSMNEGELYGPYKEGEVYKLSKLVKKEKQPDSIRISQIVIIPKTQEEIEAKRNVADSLLNLVKTGTKLASLAQFSEDASTLDPMWIQLSSVPYAESLLSAKKGEAILEVAEGFHIIQVLDRGKEELKIQIATIDRNITPSEETRTKVYQDANAFVASINPTNDFNKVVGDKKITKKVANSLTKSSRNIQGLDNARSLIREAFFAEENSLISYRQNNSPIFELGENYVVGYLKKYREEGYSSLEDVKKTIEPIVRKQKKATQLIAQFNEAVKETNELEQIAGKVKGSVKDVTGLTFSAFNIQGIGIEPKINGLAMEIEKGKLSAPIEGNNGVYVINVSERHAVNDADLAVEKEKSDLRRNFQNRVNSEVSRMLTDMAEISDNRITFQ